MQGSITVEVTVGTTHYRNDQGARVAQGVGDVVVNDVDVSSQTDLIDPSKVYLFHYLV